MKISVKDSNEISRFQDYLGLTKEWYEQRAKLEEGMDVSAGVVTPVEAYDQVYGGTENE